MKGKKRTNKKVRIGIVIALVTGIMFGFATLPRPVLEIGEEGEWNILWEFDLASAAEADPGIGESGWLAIWCYEHGNTGDLTTNATVWDPDEGGFDAPSSVYAYAHADAFSEDLASGTSFDFVVRCRFSYAHCGYGGDSFDESRVRCSMDVTCDSWADGNDLDGDVDYGTLAVSSNGTYPGDGHLYVNFYWNADDTNGFQINPDATITISSIKIEAKY